ncbi:MAG: sulfur carrier protein ThiS [Pseudomonadales bacterium]|nr:sulfur carrier protein ThiS [Pseudomonadales bacterium]
MKIELNGSALEVADTLTVAELLLQLSLTNRRVAVEVNLDIIPRSEYANYHLAQGDRVEIVHAIGGG